MRFVGLVEDPQDASRSLERMGMLPEVPPLARARSPNFEDELLPMWDLARSSCIACLAACSPSPPRAEECFGTAQKSRPYNQR